MGYDIIHGTSPLLLHGASFLGGYTNSNRETQAIENRANAQVRSNELSAIGGGINQAVGTIGGSYALSKGNVPAAILGLSGPQALGGYTANTAYANQAQQNRMAMQDDAQAYQTQRDATGHQNRLAQMEAGVAYRMGASPEYMQQIGEQLGATSPAQAKAYGFAALQQGQTQADIQSRVQLEKAAIESRQGLAPDETMVLSKADSMRRNNYLAAKSAIYSNPAMTVAPGVLNSAGQRSLEEINANLATIRPSVPQKRQPMLGAQYGGEAAGYSMDSPVKTSRTLPDGRIETFFHDGKGIRRTLDKPISNEDNQQLPTWPMSPDNKPRQIGMPWKDEMTGAHFVVKNAKGDIDNLGGGGSGSGITGFGFKDAMNAVPEEVPTGQYDKESGDAIMRPLSPQERARQAYEIYSTVKGIDAGPKFSGEELLESDRIIQDAAMFAKAHHKEAGVQEDTPYVQAARTVLDATDENVSIVDKARVANALVTAGHMQLGDLRPEVRKMVEAMNPRFRQEQSIPQPRQMPQPTQQNPLMPQVKEFRDKETGELVRGYKIGKQFIRVD